MRDKLTDKTKTRGSSRVVFGKYVFNITCNFTVTKNEHRFYFLSKVFLIPTQKGRHLLSVVSLE